MFREQAKDNLLLRKTKTRNGNEQLFLVYLCTHSFVFSDVLENHDNNGVDWSKCCHNLMCVVKN